MRCGLIRYSCDKFFGVPTALELFIIQHVYSVVPFLTIINAIISAFVMYFTMQSERELLIATYSQSKRLIKLNLFKGQDLVFGEATPGQSLKTCLGKGSDTHFI